MTSQGNGRTPVFVEKNTADKLSSKNLGDDRLPRVVDHPKHEKQDIGLQPLMDVGRRLSSTIFDLKKETNCEGAGGIKVYKRRWIILLVFVVFAFVGTIQWTMYAIIANVVTKYYKVSNLSVDFTTLSFLLSYLIAFLPAGWILNNMWRKWNLSRVMTHHRLASFRDVLRSDLVKSFLKCLKTQESAMQRIVVILLTRNQLFFGLRWAMLIGCFLNTLGCFLRIFSVPTHRFWLTMIGQCTVGVSQVFALMIPTRLAAVWFPAHQVSFACGFAFNGILVGNAVGLVAPPILVRNSDNMVDIAEDLDFVYLILAASSFFSFLLTAAFFQEEPPLPPSQAERLQRAGQASTKSPQEFLNSLARLLKKRAYMILLVSLASIVGVFCTIVTLLNQILLPHFPVRTTNRKVNLETN